MDGKLDTTLDTGGTSIVYSTYPLTIGRQSNPAAAYLEGYISLVRIYNRALSEAEIKVHYQYLMGKVNRLRRRL